MIKRSTIAWAVTLILILTVTPLLAIHSITPAKADSEVSIHFDVPSSVETGETAEFSWWIEGLYIEHQNEVQFLIYDSDGVQVQQETYTNWAGVGSESSPIVFSWTVPIDASAGTYTCKLRLFYGISLPLIPVKTSYKSFSVNAPPSPLFDFELSAPESININVDESPVVKQFDVDITLTEGDTQSVELTCSSQNPTSGVEITISPATVYPSDTSTLRIALTGTPATGFYDFTVRASSDTITETANCRLSLYSGPVIFGFSPENGWAGVEVTIIGSNLAGGQVFLGVDEGGHYVGLINHTETGGSFYIPGDAPHQSTPITVITPLGRCTSADELEVFPRPDYCFNWGFKFHNPNDSHLSYPMWPPDDGDYKSCFGSDQVYAHAEVCVGLGACIPFIGCACLGWTPGVAIGPGPLALLYYYAIFEWLGTPGECFGMSAASLLMANGAVTPSRFDSAATRVNELEREPLGRGLDHLIDYMHGRQTSLECIFHYIDSAVWGPSDVLSEVEAAIDNGKYGIISIVHGTRAHAMVPYLVEDVDENHTRIYVYDSNLEEYSNESAAISALRNRGAPFNHPPYIVIDKTGTLWEWSYERTSTSTWGGWWGAHPIIFMPYETILENTLPVSLGGLADAGIDAVLDLIEYVHGDAGVEIEDAEGRALGVDETGSWVMEIPGAVPIPAPEIRGYALPFGNYTSRITGQDDGTYSWYNFAGAHSAFAIEDAGVTAGTKDMVTLSYKGNYSRSGLMSFETSDDTKVYSATIIKTFTEQGAERAYLIKNTSISQNSVASFETSSDFESLIYYNNGPDVVTFDVQFQTTAVSEEVAAKGSLTEIPSVVLRGIAIGPYERQVLTPGDWLDLDHSEINVEAAPISAPLITGVNPGSGTRGEALDVVITGTNFVGTTTVNFGPGVTVDSSRRDSSTQITAHITMAAHATPGIRDISVVSSIAGTGILPDGFTVNEAPAATPFLLWVAIVLGVVFIGSILYLLRTLRKKPATE
jgi:hypothetical protein